MVSTLLFIILVILLVGALLNNAAWGYGPAGGLGGVLLLILVLYLLGVIR